MGEIIFAGPSVKKSVSILIPERHASILVTCCKCGTGFKASPAFFKRMRRPSRYSISHWLSRISVHSQLCSSPLLGWGYEDDDDRHVDSKETISISSAMKVDDSTQVRIKVD
jgi:hypothetical protein